jgi:hypothetical protein
LTPWGGQRINDINGWIRGHRGARLGGLFPYLPRDIKRFIDSMPLFTLQAMAEQIHLPHPAQ